MDSTEDNKLKVKRKIDTPKLRFTSLWWGALCVALLLSQLLFSPGQADEKIVFEYPEESPRVDLKTQIFLDKLPPDSMVAVWLFFKDKGIKSPDEYQTALQLCADQLSLRSLKRRTLRGPSPGLDFTDIPVKIQYLDELKKAGVRIRVVSKWLNAVSVLVNKQQIERIGDFPFVRAVKKVVTFTRSKSTWEEKPLKKMGKVGAIPRLRRDVPHELPLLDYGESYAQLAQIHVPDLHNLGYTGKGVLITMLDTGYWLHHPAFDSIVNSGRLIATHDFINQDDNVEDQNDQQRGHGTAVWSVVGGWVNDTLVGCAYGASFALAKTEIVAEEIQIEEDNWVAGIEWADSIGADVVSSSLGYNDWYTYQDMDGNTALCTIAGDLAVSKGIVVVNAAGNERDDPWHYIIAPADGDSVIAAGAVDLQGNIASFSSMGPTYDGRIKPDVDACGVSTYCASSNGGYTYSGGTSLATPLVAGACALLLEAHPDWNPVQVREALWSTASQSDHPDNSMGYGIVDAAKASGFQYLVVSPPDLHFEASLGDTQSQQKTLSIADWQGGIMKWKAHTDASWITLFPDSGFTSDLMWVIVHPSNLKAGINQDSIVISADSSGNPYIKVPIIFAIHPATKVRTFPNPFADSLTIVVEKSDATSEIKVSVFTVSGELVYGFSGEDDEEIFEQTWDGRNEKGEEVATGIYLLKIDIDDKSEIVKVAKVK